MKIGKKILLTSVSLITAGILAAGGIISSVYIRRQLDSTGVYVETLVDQIAVNIGTRTREYEDTMLNMVQNWDLFGSYLNKKDSNIYYNRRAVASFVNQRNTSRSPILDFYALDNSSVITYYDYKTQSFKDVNQEIADYIRVNRKVIPKGAIWRCFASEPEKVYMIRSIYSPVRLEYDGVIAVGISRDIFERQFLALEQSKNGKVTILNPEGEVIFGRNGEQLNPASILEKSRESGDSRHLIRSGSRSYLVRNKETEDKKWNVIYLINEQELFGPMNQMLVAILIVCSATILAAVICAAVISGSITRGIRQLYDHIQRLRQGEWTTLSVPYSKDEIGQITIAFNDMAVSLQDMVEHLARQKLETEQAEYKALQAEYGALQARVNPHFIFNAMESLNAVAKLNGQDTIASICTSLGRLMRVAINRRKSTVTLREELSYVSDYLEVQKFMMEDRLEVFFDVEPQAEECQVPSLLLQPLVENAVIHGVENLSEGAVIFVSSDLIAGPKGEAAVVIQIADNGAGMDEETLKRYCDFSVSAEEDSSSHFGLVSVEKRIEILYGQEYGITVSSQVGKGTVVKVVLPAIDRNGGFT